MRTQWRSGFSGATGLDYQGVHAALRMMRVPARRWPELFDDLQTLECAALEAMRET